MTAAAGRANFVMREDPLLLTPDRSSSDESQLRCTLDQTALAVACRCVHYAASTVDGEGEMDMNRRIALRSLGLAAATGICATCFGLRVAHAAEGAHLGHKCPVGPGHWC